MTSSRFAEASQKHLKQFLDHLRKREVVPARKLVPDKSSLTDILSRYENYLRSERGLVTTTIIGYQPFVRKFLVERFHKQPYLFGEVKPSDISNFVLRHSHSMSLRRAQLMTTVSARSSASCF